MDRQLSGVDIADDEDDVLILAITFVIDLCRHADASSWCTLSLSHRPTETASIGRAIFVNRRFRVLREASPGHGPVSLGRVGACQCVEGLPAETFAVELCPDLTTGGCLASSGASCGCLCFIRWVTVLQVLQLGVCGTVGCLCFRCK